MNNMGPNKKQKEPKWGPQATPSRGPTVPYPFGRYHRASEKVASHKRHQGTPGPKYMPTNAYTVILDRRETQTTPKKPKSDTHRSTKGSQWVQTRHPKLHIHTVHDTPTTQLCNPIIDSKKIANSQIKVMRHYSTPSRKPLHDACSAISAVATAAPTLPSRSNDSACRCTTCSSAQDGKTTPPL